MKISKALGDKWLTITTRKANYQDIYFAKYTIWKSKEAFDKGDCMGTITMSSLYLGNTLRDTENIVTVSATNILREIHTGNNITEIRA